MNSGKVKCEILKQIRQKIADANGIEYSITPCTYEGDCQGTCPKCESEVHFIERKLNELQQAGKKIIVSGLAAGMLTLATGSSALLTSSCSHTRILEGDVPNPDYVEQLEGDVYAPDIEENDSTETQCDKK